MIVMIFLWTSLPANCLLNLATPEFSMQKLSYAHVASPTLRSLTTPMEQAQNSEIGMKGLKLNWHINEVSSCAREILEIIPNDLSTALQVQEPSFARWHGVQGSSRQQAPQVTPGQTP